MSDRILEALWRPESGLVVALFATYLLYFVFRRTTELGKHAAQNTSATLVITGANVLAAWLFVEDINGFAQSAYDALRVPRLPAEFWAGYPLWLVSIIALVAKDFADYWNHRIMHTRWGWPAHATHHSDTHVNAFTGYRVHFLETIVMHASYVLLLTWLQMPEIIPVVVLVASLHNIYVHMDLEFTHGPLRHVIASPVFHRWHHADAPEAYGKNLANLMPIWDVLFGTYYNPGPCRAPMGAKRSGLEDKNPLLIYIYPFQEWRRLIRDSRKARTRQPQGAPEESTYATASTR